MSFAYAQGQLNLMELKREGRGLSKTHLAQLRFSMDHFPLTTEMLIVNATSKHHRMQCNYTAHKRIPNRALF